MDRTLALCGVRQDTRETAKTYWNIVSFCGLSQAMGDLHRR